MPIQDDLPSLYAYTRWADARMFASVRKLSHEQFVREPVPGWTSIQDTLVHIAGATSIWARRLQGEVVSLRPMAAEYPTVDDVERFFHEGHAAFDRLIAELTPERLATLWTYRNLAGEQYTTPIWAVFRHVANHATYHRGQVASKLKRFGVDPPITDFVYWAFEHCPQVAISE